MDGDTIFLFFLKVWWSACTQRDSWSGDPCRPGLLQRSLEVRPLWFKATGDLPKELCSCSDGLTPGR